jgi:glucose-1-phosphate thymidylyltransferase
LRGLVLSGGKGSRLRPFTYTGAKQLIPIANKPILFYAIEALVEAGITDIGVITGDTGDQIREALGDGSGFGARLTFIPQEAPLGLAHAVLTAQPFLGGDPFVMFLGDNFLRGGIVPFVQSFDASGATAQILVTEVENPSAFGVVELGEDGRPVRLLEKPAEPATNLAIIGIYMFTPHVFEAIAKIEPSRRGELEITDAIQKLIDHGADVRAEIVRSAWIDTGRPDDLLNANAIILDDLKPAMEGSVSEDSRLSGIVVVQRGARVLNSVIEGPAIIGEESEVINSHIGPYTSVYHHTRLESVHVEGSVILERSVVENPGCLIKGSLIGRDVEIRGRASEPRMLRFALGDHSRVDLP